MIPFYLVTGFLGSGKTTLLKRILHQYSDKKRIAIIQNEFAPTSTDGIELELSGADFKLVEVNNGSVFCVCMLGNFVQSLQKVVEEYNPELLFLEASGLSDPINILELLQDEKIRNTIQLAKIITIVDALNFTRSVQMLKRTRHQVMIADLVLINKTDQENLDLETVQGMVKTINPFADCIETSYCKMELDDLILNAADHQGAAVHGQKESEGRPDVKACVLRVNTKISPEGLESFIKELQQSCPRIKGYVNCTDGQVYMLQSVFDDFTYEIVEGYVGPSEIVAFGEGLTPGKLRDHFIAHAK
jgi:G3E family GTPase